MLLSIHREGKINIKSLKSEEGRCGIIGTPCNYSYQVEIQTSEHTLLPNSFILDVDDIEKYFEETYNGKVLEQCDCCEIIAMKAVKHFNKVMGQRYSNIKVRISPGIGRWIEANN